MIGILRSILSVCYLSPWHSTFGTAALLRECLTENGLANFSGFLFIRGHGTFLTHSPLFSDTCALLPPDPRLFRNCSLAIIIANTTQWDCASACMRQLEQLDQPPSMDGWS